MRTKIEFVADDEKYFAIRPSQQDTMAAELVYKTKYSEALRHGAMTTAEALRIIEERNLFTDKDRKEISKLLVEVHSLGEKLKKINTLRDGINVIEQIRIKRLDVLRINMKRNSVLDNTAESYADEQRLQHYVVACTFKENGDPLFENRNQLLDNGDKESAALAVKYMIYLLTNDGDDYRKDWPDYQWQQANGLIDDNFEPISELSDEVKKRIEKEEATEKKSKPTRKKTAKTV